MKRTLAGLKEALPVGTRVTLIEYLVGGKPAAHSFKGMVRTVELVQTKNWALADKPKGEPHRRVSWLDWPKRDELSFDGDNTFRIDEGGVTLIYRIEGGPDADPQQGR